MGSRIKSHLFVIGASLGVFLGLIAETNGQVQIRVGENRTGASIRFGDPPVPRYYPAAPPASIRNDNYYGHQHHGHGHGHGRDHNYGKSGWEPSHKAYANPYQESYFRRFRPGYRLVVVGTSQYYVYYNLPPNTQSVVVNGISFYLSDGIYYQPRLYEGQTVYMVVPSPIP